MCNAIKEITSQSAEDFLSQLDRGNPSWGGAMQFWAFRGHSDDDKYKLIPTALRPDQKFKLGYTHNKKGIQKTNKEQIEAEFERINDFYWSIDKQGLVIPGDVNLLRTPKSWEDLEDTKKNEWPIDDLLPILAIAQHYGVHTRLLDWCDRPLVAAFFAAKGAAEKQNGKEQTREFLSVWALNFDWIIHKAFPGDCNKIPVYVVTAPRASNPNLHAQGGVFTTEKLIKREFSDKVSADSVNTLVENKWNSLKPTEKPTNPIMVHIKLHVQEANKLLRLLNQEQINSATLFPGYKGVADSLRERVLWDKQERSNYWLKR